ncbi:1499_t:CDS:2 [Diversispora eburnea]|uniref:1499_t:CDS:1 n=1 Tax=Diversispora eburnea TaxID=1213867 RepID=A0A9N8Z591_9GLOM|nr:1499_t:CDS:2 [Diversispora eburnea]
MTYCENCKVLKGLRNENKNLIDEIANKITQVDQEYSNTQEEIRKVQIEIRDIRLDKLQNEPLPPLPKKQFPTDEIIPIVRNVPKKPQVPRPTKTYHPQVPPVFFGNIPNNVSENDLRAEIEKKFGKILAISLFRREETAIVNFADMESYFEAIETRVFGFRRINLSIKQ